MIDYSPVRFHRNLLRFNPWQLLEEGSLRMSFVAVGPHWFLRIRRKNWWQKEETTFQDLPLEMVLKFLHKKDWR